MKVLVSACLMGRNCKYNGGNNYSDHLAKFLESHGAEVVEVCPEVMGGLPTPRIPCEIQNGMVMNREGVSCDQEYRKGAAIALEIAKREKIDVAVLQSRSPSCGVWQVYDGTFSKRLVDGKGIFAGLLAEHGFQMIDIEDLEEKFRD